MPSKNKTNKSDPPPPPLTNFEQSVKRSSNSEINNKALTPPVHEVTLLQTPVPLQEFDTQADLKTSRLIESTLPAYVFRSHLKLAKNEEKTISKLKEDIGLATPIPFLTEGVGLCDVYGNVDNGSKTNLLRAENKYELFEVTSAELLHLYTTNPISFEDVISNPMLSHPGKVLKCINSALPVLNQVNDIYILSTVVEDSLSPTVARLEVVCNLFEADVLVRSSKTPYLHNIVPGSVMLIHDPIFKTDSTGETLSICVQKVRDIAFFGHMAIPSSLKDNKGRAENSNNQSEYSIYTTSSSEADDNDGSGNKSLASLLMSSMSSSSCEEKYARNEWKDWGNEYSVRRMHSQALVAYSIALRFDPGSIELAAARGASLINLGMFSAALKDVDSVVSQDPFNTGLILRKSHCLWGLGKYLETIDYLKECFEKLLSLGSQNPDEDMIRKSMFIHNIISKTEKMIKQQRGDAAALNSETLFKNQQPQPSYSEPEYYSHIKFQTSKNMDGDGSDSRRFVVANQAVSAGTLLVKTKAFSVVFQQEDGLGGVETGQESHNDELINLTMQKLLIEKPTEADLYNFLDDSTNFSNKIVELSKPEIINFCEKYCYASYHHTDQASMDIETSNECSGLSPSHTISRGLWTFPAKVKHACVGGNAIWYIYGNIMFIRAICKIKDGEELVMAHVNPTKSYDFRKQFLNKKGIECYCTLCQFEKTESDSTKAKRNEILKDGYFKAFSYFNECSKESKYNELKRLKYRLEDLQTLRSAYAKLNFPIVEPLYYFGLYLMKAGSFEEAVIAFEKAFYVVDNTAAVFTLVNLSFLLSYCYMAKKKNNDKNRSKKWFNAMKTYAKLSYGSLNPIKYKFKAEYEFLKRKGIAV